MIEICQNDQSPVKDKFVLFVLLDSFECRGGCLIVLCGFDNVRVRGSSSGWKV